jgi:hypothetical protein
MIKSNLESRDNSENKPVKVSPIISFIIFLERIFEIISPAVEFLGRGLVTLVLMASIHPALIINIILIVWSFIPLVEVLEI